MRDTFRAVGAIIPMPTPCVRGFVCGAPEYTQGQKEYRGPRRPDSNARWIDRGPFPPVRNIGNHKMAPKSKRTEPKKAGRGRPSTGKDPLVAVRLSTERIKQIDAWAKREGAASRSEAIRRLVDQSLVAATQQPRRGSHKGASKATELASEEIDRRVDHSLPGEERERRKRQLTKGPKEFRDIRGDLPKSKV
jgi:Arc/MetJ-type ribon-helix-helix transcriptional regulator